MHNRKIHEIRIEYIVRMKGRKKKTKPQQLKKKNGRRIICCSSRTEIKFACLLAWLVDGSSVCVCLLLLLFNTYAHLSISLKLLIACKGTGTGTSSVRIKTVETQRDMMRVQCDRKHTRKKIDIFDYIIFFYLGTVVRLLQSENSDGLRCVWTEYW